MKSLFEAAVAFAAVAILLSTVSSNLSGSEVSNDESRHRTQGQDTQLAIDNRSAASGHSTEAEAVTWSVFAVDGGQVNLGGLRLGSAIGQTAVGTASLGNDHLSHGYLQDFLIEWENCCIPPTVGDVNQSGNVDITDISVMIDHQFLSLAPLVCTEEGDIDFSREIDITDLQIMVDYQYLTLDPFPPCP